MHENNPESLFKTRSPGPQLPVFLIQKIWGNLRICFFFFLLSTQEILLQVVPRLDFEKHYPTLSDLEVSTYKNCKSIQLVIDRESFVISPSFKCKEAELEEFVLRHQVTLS